MNIESSDEDLNEAVYEQVCDISEDGNVLMDEDDYEGALKKFQLALTLLPEPKNKWEAYTWLKSSTGDALFFLNEFQEAKEEFFDAMNGPDGVFNPFILMRLGECFFETGDGRAQDFLLKAFMLEGCDLFQDEDPKYLALIERIVKK